MNLSWMRAGARVGCITLSSLFVLNGCGAYPMAPPLLTRTDSGHAQWNNWGQDASAARDQSAPAPVDVPLAFADASVGEDVSNEMDHPSPRDVAEPRDSTADVADYCEQIRDRTPLTMYLASDDSNSVASPAIVRRLLRAQRPVDPSLIRTHEFMNYYNPVFSAAERGSVNVQAAMRAGATPTEWSMQAAIQSEARTLNEVRPMSLTFVLDTSGSMGHDGRIERERAVVRAIAAQLRAGDIVSATTWNTGDHTVLDGHQVVGPNDPAILAMANGLNADGGTDLEGGLSAGYALARANYRTSRLNRVVLISDGEANVGETNGRIIGTESHRAEGDEIYLVGVGVGDGVGDTLMDAVTDMGRGAYIFIDTEAEATVMFGPRFVENMEIAVRSVRLEMQLPWYMKIFSTSAEAISTDPRAVDPQHLAPNDAMVFQQVLRACSANIVNPEDTVSLRATFEDRDTRASREVRRETTVGALLQAPEAALRRGEAIVAYAEALKLRTRVAVMAAQRAVAAARAMADDAQLTEISQLVEMLSRYPNN